MIRRILFSSGEAFKLREFISRSQQYLPVKFDLIISPDASSLHKEEYEKVISDLDLSNVCSSIAFLKDKNLSETVSDIMDDSTNDKLLCLITTDEMLVEPIDESLVIKTFEESRLFSFSLRLGKNIENNSMVGMKNLVLPVKEDEHVMIWDWDKHYVDFSGPLSVHGHYYRMKDVYRMIKNTNAWSYDELEDELQTYMNYPKKLMASFLESKSHSIDPLFHGTHRKDVHNRVNEMLMNNEQFVISVPEKYNEIHFNPFLSIMNEIYAWQRQNILFKFPARGRKDKLINTLKAYHDNIVNKVDHQFILSIDEDDHELNNEQTIGEIESFPNTRVAIGPSIGKIGAVNRDIEQADPWDIVVLLSDDMMPKIKGFDMIIRKDMNKHFPDKDGVLWYNDGHQGERLNTLCILGKKYYDRFGWIYHPGYKSLFSDNDFMEVSKRLGRVKYNPLCIIEHQHWAWGYGKMDDLYSRNETFFKEDEDFFNKRMSENFELTS